MESYSAGTFALGPCVNVQHTKLIRLTGEGQGYSSTMRGALKRYQGVAEKKKKKKKKRRKRWFSSTRSIYIWAEYCCKILKPVLRPGRIWYSNKELLGCPSAKKKLLVLLAYKMFLNILFYCFTWWIIKEVHKKVSLRYWYCKSTSIKGLIWGEKRKLPSPQYITKWRQIVKINPPEYLFKVW